MLSLIQMIGRDIDSDVLVTAPKRVQRIRHSTPVYIRAQCMSFQDVIEIPGPRVIATMTKVVRTTSDRAADTKAPTRTPLSRSRLLYCISFSTSPISFDCEKVPYARPLGADADALSRSISRIICIQLVLFGCCRYFGNDKYKEIILHL
jgi:hypothetical protein